MKLYRYLMLMLSALLAAGVSHAEVPDRSNDYWQVFELSSEFA